MPLANLRPDWTQIRVLRIQYDPEHVASERLTIPIQVNGKLRSRIEVPADATEEDIVARAKEDAKLAEWLQGKKVRKVIYVKHKLVNFVVGE